KANFVRRTVDEMEANPLRWPLLQEGSDRSVKAILAVLNKGPATTSEIVAATGLNPITVHNYLINMYLEGEIRRVGFGRYALPTEGLGRYVLPAEAILKCVGERAGNSGRNSRSHWLKQSSSCWLPARLE